MPGSASEGAAPASIVPATATGQTPATAAATGEPKTAGYTDASAAEDKFFRQNKHRVEGINAGGPEAKPVAADDEELDENDDDEKPKPKKKGSGDKSKSKAERDDDEDDDDAEDGDDSDDDDLNEDDDGKAAADDEDEDDDEIAPDKVLGKKTLALLKRHHVPAKVVAAMQPDDREEFVESLRQTTRTISELQRAKAQRERDGGEGLIDGADERAGGSEAPPTREAEESWKQAAGYFGEEHVGHVRNAVTKTVKAEASRAVQQANAPLVRVLTQLLQRIEREDIDSTIEKLDLPEGVDKTSKRVRKAILAHVHENFPEVDLLDNSYRKLIPKAASALYADKQREADLARRRADRRKLLSGLPETASAASQQLKPTTMKDREDRYFAGQKRGLAGRALHNFVNGRIK